MAPIDLSVSSCHMLLMPDTRAVWVCVTLLGCTASAPCSAKAWAESLPALGVAPGGVAGCSWMGGACVHVGRSICRCGRWNVFHITGVTMLTSKG